MYILVDPTLSTPVRNIKLWILDILSFYTVSRHSNRERRSRPILTTGTILDSPHSHSITLTENTLLIH